MGWYDSDSPFSQALWRLPRVLHGCVQQTWVPSESPRVYAGGKEALVAWYCHSHGCCSDLLLTSHHW